MAEVDSPRSDLAPPLSSPIYISIAVSDLVLNSNSIGIHEEIAPLGAGTGFSSSLSPLHVFLSSGGRK